MRDTDAIVYVGVLIFALATVLGTADLFKSPWPALGLVGLWICVFAWFVEEFRLQRRGQA